MLPYNEKQVYILYLYILELNFEKNLTIKPTFSFKFLRIFRSKLVILKAMV